MKRRSLAALPALLSLALPLPVRAADPPPPMMTGAGPVATAGFVGARLRVPLGGGKAGDRTLRAGLTIAPMLRSGGADFRSPAWRIGEGLEFGFRDADPAPQLSLAGLRLTPPRRGADGRIATKGRTQLSDGGTVAAVLVGVAVAAGVGLLVALDAQGDPDPCTPGECNNN